MNIQVGIITVSDRAAAGQYEDFGGPRVAKAADGYGWSVIVETVVPDDKEQIQRAIREQIAKGAHLVLTTGGTGVAPRDVTPEALDRVCDKKIPGFGELFRWISFQKIGTSTIQSRADAGVASGTYLFVLPGSTGACKDGWDEILVHQLDSLTNLHFYSIVILFFYLTYIQDIFFFVF